MAGAAEGHAANWSFNASLTGSRSVSIPRGRVMGGSSTVNGGVFVRATPDDFDGWAALGNDEWSFARVLPFLKRMEDDRDFPDGEFHGTGGPDTGLSTECLRIAPVEQGVRLGLRRLGLSRGDRQERARAHRDAGACR